MNEIDLILAELPTPDELLKRNREVHRKIVATLKDVVHTINSGNWFSPYCFKMEMRLSEKSHYIGVLKGVARALESKGYRTVGYLYYDQNNLPADKRVKGICGCVYPANGPNQDEDGMRSHYIVHQGYALGRVNLEEKSETPEPDMPRFPILQR